MSDKDVYNGIELLLRLVDAATRASETIRNARAQGRDVSKEEVKASLDSLQDDIDDLSEAIAARGG